jgi:hypothetical protein
MREPRIADPEAWNVAYQVHWLDLIEEAREKVDQALALVGEGRDADALPHIKEAIRLLQASISQ